jgi:glutamine cyclotransferase
MKNFSMLLIILLFCRPGFSQDAENDNLPVYTYLIINSFPHDHEAYTQGLIYCDGYFYESTGRRGESTIRKVNITTGAPLQWQRLDKQYFGEGITLLNDQIIQLTWESYTGFIYDKETFAVLEEFYYNTEGWGITNDGENLIMSDGSSKLYVLEPGTYAVLEEIQVTANGLPIRNLNELEYVRGEIFANVMPSNRIARIDPDTGNITGWIDLSGILKTLQQAYAVDVLNGIAYDAENDRLFVTGKLWPKVYEIKLIPAGK